MMSFFILLPKKSKGHWAKVERMVILVASFILPDVPEISQWFSCWNHQVDPSSINERRWTLSDLDPDTPPISWDVRSLKLRLPLFWNHKSTRHSWNWCVSMSTLVWYSDTPNTDGLLPPQDLSVMFLHFYIFQGFSVNTLETPQIQATHCPMLS